MSDDVLNTQQVLIDRLREEVNQADKIIQLEIERQTEDLGVMRKRMKDHLDFTRTTQRCQLGEIDASYFILFFPSDKIKFKYFTVSFWQRLQFVAGRSLQIDG